MGDLGDYWRDAEAGGYKRSRRRPLMNPCDVRHARKVLRKASVPFEERNGGTILLIPISGTRVSFYPTKDKWLVRGVMTFGDADDFVAWYMTQVRDP